MRNFVSIKLKIPIFLMIFYIYSITIIGQQLVVRWHRAHKMKPVAEETFSMLAASFKRYVVIVNCDKEWVIPC